MFEPPFSIGSLTSLWKFIFRNLYPANQVKATQRQYLCIVASGVLAKTLKKFREITCFCRHCFQNYSAAKFKKFAAQWLNFVSVGKFNHRRPNLTNS